MPHSVASLPPTVIVAQARCTHYVTLLNRSTDHEVMLTVKTWSPRFAPVMRAIQKLKADQGLVGYEVLEILDCNSPF